ncbi:MAG: lipid-binding SYLF domain-containing protein, partial [Spirochaetota bacterium]
MKSGLILLSAVLVLWSGAAEMAAGGYTGESKIEEAAEVLSEIMDIPEKSIPPALFKNIYGIAVIPGVIKAGFVIGGRFGQGILVVRTPEGRWSNPVFINITGASVGFQAGVQSTD